jgi:hypothetical protein
LREWTSIAEVAEDFGFPQYRADADNLKRELRKIITRLHPDRTGGVFKTKRSEERFHQAMAADEFIELNRTVNTSLVPIGALKEIVEVIGRINSTANQETSTTLSHRYSLEEKYTLSRKLFPAKISSGAISSIILFILAFPKTFADSPILGEFVHNNEFQMLSLLGLAFFGFFFILTYVGERIIESRIDYAMSEGALQRLMREIQYRASHDDGKITFSNLVDAMSELMGSAPSWKRRNNFIEAFRMIQFIPSRPDRTAIEKATLVQTQRLVENGILKKYDKPSIERTYFIDREALEDL